MGICGTGMGTLAGILKARGIDVRGSDAGGYPPMSDLLASWNIEVMVGYASDNLDWKPDFVVVGNVIRRTNPEAHEMRERNIPHCSFPECLAELVLGDRHPIVITGTHGKTTTTSLTAWLLESAQQQPGLVVGGVPHNFGTSFHLGEGKHFVVEGDEYDTAYFDKEPKFLHYRPQTAIITNIEFDHADIYSNVDAIQKQFSRFAKLIPNDGLLLHWSGCNRATEAASSAKGNVESYGIDVGDWAATNVHSEVSGSRFDLHHKNQKIGSFETALVGNHNILNATAALAAVITRGVSVEAAQQGLANFSGVKKRMELKGVANGVTVIDDFAHHPTAVLATVQTVRRNYPNARLFCCFEVESNTSRRRVFQADYPPAFEGANTVLFCKPLEKADNLSAEERLSLPEVVEVLEQQGIRSHVIEEVDDMVAWLVAELNPGDVVLGMSGRHFYGLHDKLLMALGRHQ